MACAGPTGVPTPAAPQLGRADREAPPPSPGSGLDWSLSRTIERTLDEATRRRAKDFRKVVLAGQSFGGYITLEAAERMPDLFAAIAAPGVRSIGATATRSLDPSVTERSPQRIRADRIALVFPKEDAFFGNIVRGEAANRTLAARQVPYLLLDETTEVAGHGGGTGSRFTLRLGACLQEFLAALTLRPERFVCPAASEWRVVQELFVPRQGLPR